jgi:hypothetical protein
MTSDEEVLIPALGGAGSGQVRRPRSAPGCRGAIQTRRRHARLAVCLALLSLLGGSSGRLVASEAAPPGAPPAVLDRSAAAPGATLQVVWMDPYVRCGLLFRCRLRLSRAADDAADAAPAALRIAIQAGGVPLATT